MLSAGLTPKPGGYIWLILTIMNVRHSVEYFIKLNPGALWSEIMSYFVDTHNCKPSTVKWAIRQFKHSHPHLYHPGLSQSQYNCGYTYDARKQLVIGPPNVSTSKPSTQEWVAVDTDSNVDTEPVPTPRSYSVEPEPEPPAPQPVATAGGDLPEKARVPSGCVEADIIAILPLEGAPKSDLEAEAVYEEQVVLIGRPPPEISFEVFVERYAYPRFGGLFEFQKECHRYIWAHEFSMINLPRDHGKSIYLAFLVEWVMDCLGWDVLYLGWTDRRKEIAEFIFAYFTQMNMIDSGRIHASSPYNFLLVNGCSFKTYSITAREVLGMHALGETLDQQNRRLLMIIDDPIDETFREERHKEQKLEMKWRSTLSNINPDKIIFTGTKKFEEDFFHFIKKTYRNKLKHFYRRTHLCTPFIENLDFAHPLLAHLKKWEELTEEQQNTIQDKANAHPCYNPDIEFEDRRYKVGLAPEHNLLCPERWTEEMLREKRIEVGEYWWFSEYEQFPHPITGEVWEDVSYIKSREAWEEYDLGVIVVDPATATEAKKAGYTAEQKLKATSYTGLVVFLRHLPTNEYHVLFDLTDHYEFEHKLWLITEYYEWIKARFLKVRGIKVVIEKQGGGDDLISAAMTRKFARWDKSQMRISWAASIVDVHQTRDKVMRIDDYLRVPIKKGKIKFLITLRNSELLKEIMNFPYCDKFDAVDALATGIHEADNYIRGLSPKEVKEAIDRIRARRIAKYEANWERTMQRPWELRERRGRSKKSIF